MKMTTRSLIKDETLIVDLGRPVPVVSSAPCRGGLQRCRHIVNHQVPANPVSTAGPPSTRRDEDPARTLSRLAEALGLTRPCVGLMTAVPLAHLVCSREQRGALWVEVFATVGLSNAVCAGEPPLATRPEPSRTGTINLIVVTNARLSASALVGALQVATESKTAAVLAADIVTRTGARATGTGTDATVIASGDGAFCRYSGTHTDIGALIARAVSRGVSDGIAAWQLWCAPRRI